MAKNNIFVSVGDACVQRDADGLYHIHIGQRGITYVEEEQVFQMMDAMTGLFAILANSEEDCDAEG